MSDVARRQGITVNAEALSRRLGGVPVVITNARRGEGLTELKEVLSHALIPTGNHFFNARTLAPEAIHEARNQFRLEEDYAAYLLLQHGRTMRFLSAEEQQV